MASDVEWKSMMHQPVAFFVVMPVALLFSFATPLLSWVMHLLMDYVETYYLGLASMPEMALTVILAAILVMGELNLCRKLSGEPVTFRAFVSWELDRSLGEAKQWLPSRANKKPIGPPLPLDKISALDVQD